MLQARRGRAPAGRAPGRPGQPRRGAAMPPQPQKLKGPCSLALPGCRTEPEHGRSMCEPCRSKKKRERSKVQNALPPPPHFHAQQHFFLGAGEQPPASQPPAYFGGGAEGGGSAPSVHDASSPRGANSYALVSLLNFPPRLSRATQPSRCSGSGHTHKRVHTHTHAVTVRCRHVRGPLPHMFITITANISAAHVVAALRRQPNTTAGSPLWCPAAAVA